MNYKEKRTILNDLNMDKSHFVNSNDICTPMECVEEMVDTIPMEFWERTDGVRVLDPCCGNGNFPAYIETKITNPNSELCLNEINLDRVSHLSGLFDNITLTTKDFFLFDDTDKYDLIVGNPPYAKMDINGVRCAKNHNLSRSFVTKSLEMLNDGGYLVYIIPDNWMSLSDRNDTVELLSEYQFIHLNIHLAKKYFKGVGSSFTWFVLQKVENSKPFVIENGYRKCEISTVKLDKGMSSIPLFYNEIVKSILNKTIYDDHPRMNIETTSDLHKYTKKDCLSKNQCDVFKHKIWHTQSQQIWANRPHKFQMGWNVFISTTSYYSTFVDEDCGMTQSIAFIQCVDEQDASNTKVILDHPLYKFINDIHRYGNFNNNRILQLFPKPITDDVWKSFGITDDEKSFILEFNG